MRGNLYSDTMVQYFDNLTNNTFTGLMQYINSAGITNGLFGISIVSTIYILALITLYNKSPKFSFVTAGFFAMIISMFLAFLGLVGEPTLLLSMGAFFLPLMIIALTPSRG